jgi:hypothetical protein
MPWPQLIAGPCIRSVYHGVGANTTAAQAWRHPWKAAWQPPVARKDVIPNVKGASEWPPAWHAKYTAAQLAAQAVPSAGPAATYDMMQADGRM